MASSRTIMPIELFDMIWRSHGLMKLTRARASPASAKTMQATGIQFLFSQDSCGRACMRASVQRARVSSAHACAPRLIDRSIDRWIDRASKQMGGLARGWVHGRAAPRAAHLGLRFPCLDVNEWLFQIRISHSTNSLFRVLTKCFNSIRKRLYQCTEVPLLFNSNSHPVLFLPKTLRLVTLARDHTF